MLITVKRFKFLDKATIGHLLIDGQDTGFFTLEDKFREQDGVPVSSWKIPHETAIPKGRYKVVVDFSNHFKKELPHVLDVPGFEGIRIHPGNTDLDTEGCILVGSEWSGGDFVGHSREAFASVFEKIKAAPSVEIEIG